jgi:glucokinase
MTDCVRDAALRWLGTTSVGIGVPGLYNEVAGTIRFTPNLPIDWADFAIAAPITAAVGAPVALINDARAFILAEVRLGAARGARTAVGLTLGTGVGGGVAIDGRVLLGHDGTAGEIGHITIDPDGPFCNCGNRGCLEAYARADQIALACGAPDVETAVRLAEEGDQRAQLGLEQVGRYLGIGIASVVTVLAPDVVVLGGGVAKAGKLLLDPIRDELHRRVRLTSVDRVELAIAELGYWAGAIGAAIHGADRFATGTDRRAGLA